MRGKVPADEERTKFNSLGDDTRVLGCRMIAGVDRRGDSEEATIEVPVQQRKKRENLHMKFVFTFDHTRQELVCTKPFILFRTALCKCTMTRKQYLTTSRYPKRAEEWRYVLCTASR